MSDTWQKVKISDVCDSLDNKRIPISKEAREKGNIPYYGATGIVDFVKDYIFDEKLLLVGEDGADWSSNANTAYLINGKSWVNNHAHVLRCVKINDVFLKEYINYQDFSDLVGGSTRGKLTKGDLEKILVPFPSLEIQQKIALILSTVDEEIQKTGQIIEKTEKLKNGLMNELLTKGIGHKKFKKTKVGEIPEDWEIRQLSDVCDVRDGTHESPKYVSTGYPLITSKNLTEYGLDFSDIKYISETDFKNISKRSKVDTGDILFGMIGTIGKPIIVDSDKDFSIKNVALIKFFNDSRIDRKFLLHFLKSHLTAAQFIKMQDGSTQKFVSLNTIRNLYVVVPNINEQKQFSNIIESINQKIVVNINYKNRLLELKIGLMNDIFSQKVEVN